MAAPLALVGGGDGQAKGKGKAPYRAPPVPVGGRGKGKTPGKTPAHAIRKNDKEWILAEVVRRPGCAALKYAQADLSRDEEFVLAVVSRDGTALRDVDSSLRKNKRIVLAAVSQTPLMFREVDTDLRQDRDVITAAGFAHLLADFSLPVEPEVAHSFDVCRWIAADDIGRVGGNYALHRWWTSPGAIVDAMLPPTKVLEAANPLSRQIRGAAPVLACNVDVHITKLTGQHLKYTVAPDDTDSALKARIAADLDVPPFCVVLLLGSGPSEMINDTPLSTYCEDGRPELKLSLMVTLRDVCLLASQGSRDERSSKALGVLMERALPGDQLAIDAAHEVISNEQLDSPLFVLALRLLQRILPPDQACKFFAACLRLQYHQHVKAVALGTVLQLWHAEGRDFVASNAFTDQSEEVTRETMAYLEAVIRRAGPRRVFPNRPCGGHPRVSCEKVDAMEALQRGTLDWGEVWRYAAPQSASRRLFRIVLDYDAGLAAAAWELTQNPSSLHDISVRYPVLGQALEYEAATLGVRPVDILPNLMITFVDELLYPLTKNSGSKLMVMQLDVLEGGSSGACKSETSSIDNLSAIAMQKLSQSCSESSRLVLEALTILAPRSHRGALTAACYASVHKDASVREQALELLLRLMQEADVDYVSRLLETRWDVHAKRILREVRDYFQEPETYVAEMGTYKLRYSN